MRNYPYTKEICNMSKMCNGNSVFSDCKDCLLNNINSGTDFTQLRKSALYLPVQFCHAN